MDWLFNRKWSELFLNLKGNLGFVAVIGIGLAIFGQDNLLCGFIGVVIMTAGVIFFITLSIPKQYLPVERKVGKAVSLTELNDFLPKPLKIGIVGLSGAGKTTLLEFLCQIPNSNRRTQGVSAFITTTKTYPPKYLAVIDGIGSTFDVQFDIAKEVEYLIIVVDHNSDDKISDISQDRLIKTSNFIQQLIKVAQRRKNKNYRKVHIILNKTDLWESLDKEEVLNLKKWFCSEAEKVEASSFYTSFTQSIHSNKEIENLNEILTEIKKVL